MKQLRQWAIQTVTVPFELCVAYELRMCIEKDVTVVKRPTSTTLFSRLRGISKITHKHVDLLGKPAGHSNMVAPFRREKTKLQRKPMGKTHVFKQIVAPN